MTAPKEDSKKNADTSAQGGTAPTVNVEQKSFAPVQQPVGIVEISPTVQQSDAYRNQGHITDTDPQKKAKSRDHEQEFTDLIAEQVKIRRLKLDLKPKYVLPKNTKTGQSYTMNDIKFTQFKQLNAATYVLNVTMNDSSEFQVQL